MSLKSFWLQKTSLPGSISGCNDGSRNLWVEIHLLGKDVKASSCLVQNPFWAIYPVLSYGYLDLREIPVTTILRKARSYNYCLTQYIIVHRIAHQGFDRCSCIPSIPSFTIVKLNPPITSLCQTAATSCLRDSMITQRSWIASLSIYLSSIKTQDNHTLFQVLGPFAELLWKRCSRLPYLVLFHVESSARLMCMCTWDMAW